ncbi:MAG: hypothetical protein ACWGQW_21250, partial [bacterium]
DDLWNVGKAVGNGGPWNDSTVKAGKPSDRFLMSGYDRKRLKLSHRSKTDVEIKVQVDITGTGSWLTYRSFQVPAGEGITHNFPDAFNAYWIRFVPAFDGVATAQLQYN